MMSHQLQYSNLKRSVLEKAENFFSLELVKNYFSPLINSRRALSRVKSLSCILHLLEERDALNCRNVKCLKQLGVLLENNEIGELVQSYKKFYLDGVEEELCICGEQTLFHPEPPPMSEQRENQCDFQNNNHIILDLAEPLRNISRRIGKYWPYLAQELGLREGDIEAIRAKHPKNFKLQAEAALNLWLRKEKENVSLDILDRALNGRHCKRFGLGSHLLEPM